MTARVHSEQRFTHARPCPVCQGWGAMRRGKGQRCTGFFMEERDAVVCTRISANATKEISTAAGPGWVHQLNEWQKHDQQPHRKRWLFGVYDPGTEKYKYKSFDSKPEGWQWARKQQGLFTLGLDSAGKADLTSIPHKRITAP